MEERLIFHPDNMIHQTPGSVGLTFDDVHFTAHDGVRLNGWYIPYVGAERTLLWFHGNAGNISHRVENIKLLHDNLRINIFIFDYRGYGRSEGKVSEMGTYLDGAAAVEYLRAQYQVQPRQLVIFGRSLGAAVAAEMATQVESLILILESPFVSVPEMARTIFPLLPLRCLLSTEYNTLEKAQRVKTPLLILHGDRDEIVPITQARRVFEVANEPKRFYTIPGASHNDTYLAGGEAYFAALREAIEWAAARRLGARGDLKETMGE
jgi:fermentation-respiration switch protein FrsA (DUF1100 family)